MRYALVVAVLTAGVAVGQDLPREIKTLTEEQAKTLAQDESNLSLNDLTTLSDEAAKALAKHKGFKVDPKYLENYFKTYGHHLDEGMRSGSARLGSLYLNGLTTLSDEAEKALAQHEGDVHLDGLRTLSSFVLAQKLVRDRESYGFEGGRYQYGLGLLNLTTLSDEAAKAIGQYKGGYLNIPGLTTLSDEAAQSLAQHNGWLSLGGLTTLSDGAARALSRHRGEQLSLDGLTTLSDYAIKTLAQHKGNLHLDGLTTLSEGAAKSLAKHDGGSLHLNGLTTLSDEAARALANRKASKKASARLKASYQKYYPSRPPPTLENLNLSLRGLTTLSDEAAQALRARRNTDLPAKFSR